MQMLQGNMPYMLIGVLILVACWHVFAFFASIKADKRFVLDDDDDDTNMHYNVKNLAEKESIPTQHLQQTYSSILTTSPDDVKQRLGKPVIRPIVDTVKMPTFAIRTTLDMTVPPIYARRGPIDNEVRKFWKHPNRIDDEAQADIILHIVETVFFDKEDPHPIIEKLEALPQRTPNRPNMVWLHWTPFDNLCAPYGPDKKPQFFPDSNPFCTRAKKVLYERDDVLFVGFDLGNHIQRLNNSSLKGVTEAPGSPDPWPPQFNFDPNVPPQYLLTFRGSISMGRVFRNLVRIHVNQSFGRMHEQNPSVQVHIAQSRKAKNAYPASTPSYKELMNSSYVFILRGDQRWSYRFSEVIGACSIPLIMSDGITLPYEQLIDWSQAAIQVPEALASDAQAILDLLPKDPDVIRTMRQNVCKIRDRFWYPKGALEDAFLLSVGALLQQA